MAEPKAYLHNGQSWENLEAFLQQRGIVPDNGQFTARQLARELTRQGWRWQLNGASAKATKAFTMSGTESYTVHEHGHDQVAALASILVQAIEIDERFGLAPTSPIRADIVVRAPDQRIVTLVEVKGGRDLSDQVAAGVRGNLLRFSRGSYLVPFFLVVSQEHGFLWDQRAGVLPYAPASEKFSMVPVIAHYLPWVQPEERLSANELQAAFALWLRDVSDHAPHHPAPAQDLIADIDFLEAIQGATITTHERG